MIRWATETIKSDWSHLSKVVTVSICAKLFFLTLCLLLNSPTYDKNSDTLLFREKYNPAGYWWADRLSFLLNWDGWYFFNYAMEGYSNLKQSAFYPGFPGLVRVISIMLRLLPYYEEFLGDFELEAISIMLIGFFLNFVLHILNSFLLHLVARAKGLSVETAGRVGYFLALCGPSLFHVTFYSESLFLTITLIGLLVIYHHTLVKRQPLTEMSLSKFSVLAIGLGFSGFIRSVGILNAAYLGYPLIIELFWLMQSRNTTISKYIQIIYRGLFTLIVFIFPTAVLFYLNRLLYCTPKKSDHDYKAPGFCDTAFGFFYGYIQEHYWGVRFLGQLRNGNIEVYLLSINSIIIFIAFFKRFFKENSLTDIVTLNYNVTFKRDLADKRLVEFPDFIMMAIFARTFYFYTHQNSIERFLSSYPFYFFALSDFQENAGAKSRWLLPAVIGLRLLLTPFLFVTNIHPI